MSNELKPCPFCGNEYVKVYESRNMYGQASDWIVQCMGDKWNGACGASISYLKRSRAIEVWNQRTAQQWQRITADPASLPPHLEKILITSRDGDVLDGYRKKAMYGAREIEIILHGDGDWTNLEDCLAWQPYPAPYEQPTP